MSLCEASTLKLASLWLRSRWSNVAGNWRRQGLKQERKSAGTTLAVSHGKRQLIELLNTIKKIDELKSEVWLVFRSSLFRDDV